MNNLITEIKSISAQPDFTKQEQIVNAIINCIENNHYKLGDILPSVNELSNQLGFARETVVKSYNELKNRGLIKSKQGVGYFIDSDNVKLKKTIALVLYGFQTFQQDFYNAFRKSLGKAYKIDVFFHHNNNAVYESILGSIKGRYGMYVVAPIQNQSSDELLGSFKSDRLLIIDRYQFINEEVSKVTQEFEQSLLRVFDELLESIKKYNQVILYYKDDADYPKGIHNATLNFCNTNNIPLKIEEEFAPEHCKKGTLFFTVGDSDLWSLLKHSKALDLRPGHEIGILSHNDSPVKEIIQGGITTFSTDFIKMANYAANCVKSGKFMNKIIPSNLIKRNSL